MQIQWNQNNKIKNTKRGKEKCRKNVEFVYKMKLACQPAQQSFEATQVRNIRNKRKEKEKKSWKVKRVIKKYIQQWTLN